MIHESKIVPGRVFRPARRDHGKFLLNGELHTWVSESEWKGDLLVLERPRARPRQFNLLRFSVLAPSGRVLEFTYVP